MGGEAEHLTDDREIVFIRARPERQTVEPCLHVFTGHFPHKTLAKSGGELFAPVAEVPETTLAQIPALKPLRLAGNQFLDHRPHGLGPAFRPHALNRELNRLGDADTMLAKQRDVCRDLPALCIGESKEALPFHALTAKRLVRPSLGVGTVLELLPLPTLARRLGRNRDKVGRTVGVATVQVQDFADADAGLFGILP